LVISSIIRIAVPIVLKHIAHNKIIPKKKINPVQLPKIVSKERLLRIPTSKVLLK
jgi:hypothetical protein